MPFTFFVRYKKGNSVIGTTVKALNKMEAMEKLKITESDLVYLKIVDGI